MPDIELYEGDPDQYEALQSLRDDYRSAIAISLELARKYAPQRPLDVADFCGGPGIHLSSLAEKVSIAHATIIDISPRFIEIANRREKNFSLDAICSDIVSVELDRKYDIVLSLFAYHHVPDAAKETFLRKAYDGLKEDGMMILAEIYLPDSRQTKEYYEMLLRTVPQSLRSDQLARFLHQTAVSSDFEFKVAKDFADKQIKKIGFRKLSEQKVWPTDTSLPTDVGTFVTVLTR